MQQPKPEILVYSSFPSADSVYRYPSHPEQSLQRNICLKVDGASLGEVSGIAPFNPGIGDAVNLAWKLGAVPQGQADASLPDNYEPERIAFAQRLVAKHRSGLHRGNQPGLVGPASLLRKAF